MQSTGLGPGTLYPMLARLEDQGMLVSRWQEAGGEGRPPRHMYSLTEAGRVLAQSLRSDARRSSRQRLQAKPI